MYRAKTIQTCSVMVVLLASLTLCAMPESKSSLGLGAGVPEFVFLEGQATVFGHFQLGGTLGLLPIPGVIPQNIPLPEQSVALVTSDVFTLTPKVSPGFFFLSPFIRYFPNPENNYYLQFMWTILRITSTVSGNLTPRDNVLLPTIPVHGLLHLTQSFPTVSVGYMFSTNIYYLNLAIGASYFMEPVASASLSATVPDALGGIDANNTAFGQISTEMQNAVSNATADVRRQYSILPSLHLSFGFNF